MVNHRLHISVLWTLRIYSTQTGHSPFIDWVEDLRDVRGQSKVKVRLDRLRSGNFGDHRSIGAGIIELRIDFGPGYRVYVGLQGHDVAVILSGGDKSSQRKDIQKVHQYWDDYQNHYETL